MQVFNFKHVKETLYRYTIPTVAFAIYCCLRNIVSLRRAIKLFGK